MKLKISYISVFMLLISLIRFPFESYNTYQRVFLVINSLVFISASVKKSKVSRLIKYYTFLYTCIMVISTTLRCGITLNILYALSQGLFIYNIFFVSTANYQKYGNQKDLIIMCKVLTVFILLNDLLIFSHVVFQNEGEVWYLIGNKFSVAYMHLILLAFIRELFAENYRARIKGKMLFLLIALESILINLATESSTGIIVTILFVIGIIIGDNVYVLLKNRIVFLGILLLSNLAVVSYGILINNKWISSFLTNRLLETISITGRYRIYEMLPSIVLKHPFLGYGYNSAIVSMVVGFGNAQNGILHICIQFGLVGVIAFLLLVCSAINNSQNTYLNRGTFLWAIYIMLIVSTVEISFGNMFFLLLAYFYAGNGGDYEI